MQDSADRRYHHGDLRRVIIETAVAMLGESKGWQFTMREVARRAGVSHSAPHKHFPDKAVATAPADGHTLLYAANNTISINPHVYR